MRVLLVEDHARLATTLAAGLKREGMAVDLAFDGQEALERAELTEYDVIVLDRDLPKVHGDDVCRQLVSSEYRARVLMLTAASTVGSLVEGLALGADDYLSKPFVFAVLVARIRALGRRPTQLTPPTLVHGDLSVDTVRRTATRADRTLSLRPKELAVLERLLKARGALVTSEQLLESVWDEMADPFSKTVKTTVSRLRAQLGDPPIIETVPSGYRISSP